MYSYEMIDLPNRIYGFMIYEDDLLMPGETKIMTSPMRRQTIEQMAQQRVSGLARSAARQGKANPFGFNDETEFQGHTPYQPNTAPRTAIPDYDFDTHGKGEYGD